MKKLLLVLALLTGSLAHAWTSWTPTVTGLTSATTACYYVELNSANNSIAMHFQCRITGTTNGTTISVTLPSVGQQPHPVDYTPSFLGYQYISGTPITWPKISVLLSCTPSSGPPGCDSSSAGSFDIANADGTTPSSGNSVDYRVTGTYWFQ